MDRKAGGGERWDRRTEISVVLRGGGEGHGWSVHHTDQIDKRRSKTIVGETQGDKGHNRRSDNDTPPRNHQKTADYNQIATRGHHQDAADNDTASAPPPFCRPRAKPPPPRECP